MKAIGTIISAICVATVLTEALAVGYLAIRGQLTAKTLTEMRGVLNGEAPSEADTRDGAEQQTKPSIDDVIERRIRRVWELDRRQKELAILKSLVAGRQVAVTSRQETFGKQRDQLLTELQAREKALQDAATEQARIILTKLPPADAVANLMALDLDRNVVLLKGMPERNVAELLQEFQKTKDPKQTERGQQIFDALSRGEPQNSVVQKGLKQLQSKAKKPQPKPAM